MFKWIKTITKHKDNLILNNIYDLIIYQNPNKIQQKLCNAYFFKLIFNDLKVNLGFLWNNSIKRQFILKRVLNIYFYIANLLLLLG